MNDNRTSRLFFALWPDLTIRKRLAAIQAAFAGLPGRFNHPEDLHLTLVFLGPVEAERQDCVIDAAERISLEPFSLSLDRVADWKKPRILWCGPSLTPPPLSRLVMDLEKALEGCGFPPEMRPYIPHVTLARKAPLVEAQQPLQPLHWPVEGFVLATSGGQGPGPRYKVLKKWRADS